MSRQINVPLNVLAERATADLQDHGHKSLEEFLAANYPSDVARWAAEEIRERFPDMCNWNGYLPTCMHCGSDLDEVGVVATVDEVVNRDGEVVSEVDRQAHGYYCPTCKRELDINTINEFLEY